VPQNVLDRFVSLGLMVPGVSQGYRQGRPLPCGIPEEEWDTFHDLILAEELHRCPSVGVIWGLNGGNGIGVPPIVKFGTPEQKRKFLPKVVSGQIRFCLGITEPVAGSDVASIQTTAQLSEDGSHYIVSGQKKWITNGLWADYVTTAVRTGSTGAKGISVLIIPLKGVKGVSTRKLRNSGVNASGSTFIEFDEVVVPKENLIGKENQGFKIIMSNFNAERLSLAIGAVTLARTCFVESYKRALQRRTFGHLLIENQVIRAKFASMARAIESCNAWIEQLTAGYWALHKQPQSLNHATLERAESRLGSQIALLKVQAGKVLEHSCREAQQIFGGLGYSQEGPGSVVEQISRDLRVFVVGGGSEEIMEDMGIRAVSQRQGKKARL